mmetsp:Transcript_24819/g.69524  ORF Transcript_24819/g.69524 Transcript_24819/m.69524 type:complete len:226 (-) Transcript_24819:47-724(-)
MASQLETLDEAVKPLVQKSFVEELLSQDEPFMNSINRIHQHRLPGDCEPRGFFGIPFQKGDRKLYKLDEISICAAPAAPDKEVLGAKTHAVLKPLYDQIVTQLLSLSDLCMVGSAHDTYGKNTVQVHGVGDPDDADDVQAFLHAQRKEVRLRMLKMAIRIVSNITKLTEEYENELRKAESLGRSATLAERQQRISLVNQTQLEIDRENALRRQALLGRWKNNNGN